MKTEGLPDSTERRETQVRPRRTGKQPPRAGRRRDAAPNASHAQTHGLTTAADKDNRLPEGFVHPQVELDRFMSGSLIDEGDDEQQTPTRRRSQLGYRGRIHRRILQVDEAIQQYGLFDRRGKLRAAWLTKLETLIATAIRIDSLLGLSRRPRRVESPMEWLQRRAAEANADNDTDSTNTALTAAPDTTDSVTRQRDTATTRHGDEEDL